MVPATASAIFEIGLVVLLAGGAGYLARRAGLPAVVGYLAVGLFVSPFTPGYVADRHQLELFADVGVVLLLFEVGIEINPLRLRGSASRCSGRHPSRSRSRRWPREGWPISSACARAGRPRLG